MNEEDRLYLRASHWNNGGICDYCSRSNNDYDIVETWPCDVIKVLEALEALETLRETLWTETSPNLQDKQGHTIKPLIQPDLIKGSEISASATSDVMPVNECDHSYFFSLFKPAGYLYCPKCGEEL